MESIIVVDIVYDFLFLCCEIDDVIVVFVCDDRFDVFVFEDVFKSFVMVCGLLDFVFYFDYFFVNIRCWVYNDDFRVFRVFIVLF